MEDTHLHEYLFLVAKTINELDHGPILDAVQILENAIGKGNRIWIAGNGGSAATAMHFANDLQKMCGADAIALPSQVPTITAYGNDNGWENMFADSMNSAFRNGDILVAISCSGQSDNVIRAAAFAQLRHGELIVLTGPNSVTNMLANSGGTIISVDNADIKVVEDVHMAICHAIAGELAK